MKATWLLDPEPSSVPEARRLTRSQLSDWELEDAIGDTQLLVSELVTNALRHAWGPIRLTLSRSALRGTLRCEVEDASPAPPRVCPADESDEGGRGLHLMNLLSRCWGSHWTPEGKVVWCELHICTGSDEGRAV
ncbi:ATP-binding protein [Streptomyces sp. KR80]|uniref:ATP-binding protein n=1 Tax=Streptomyces sp. KR80 TaxID=3457426 RepID=UPI003FD5BB91